MKCHWLRDKEVLEKLILYWDKGTNNGETAPYTRSVKQSEMLCPLQRKLKHVAP